MRKKVYDSLRLAKKTIADQYKNRVFPCEIENMLLIHTSPDHFIFKVKYKIIGTSKIHEEKIKYER